MKAWITKYALTEGIQEVEGKRAATIESMFVYGQYGVAHGEGKDWHTTKDSALQRAEVMRTRKIASLRATIAKLEKMTW